MRRWDQLPTKEMKKSIFIFAALFAATFVNAQITLEHTFNSDVYPRTYTTSGFTSAQYVYGDLLWGTQELNDAALVTIYDASSYEVITSFYSGSRHDLLFIAARGYFSTSNEVMILLKQGNHLVLLSETGELVQDFGEISLTASTIFEIIRMSDGTYKLYILTGENWMSGPFVTRIYSLPGNGEAQAITTPSSKRTARKIAREGQVLVETDTNTYDLRGQEMK